MNTDRWIVRCNNFEAASKYAAEQDWSLSEWAWLPAYTIKKTIQIFERVHDGVGSDDVEYWRGYNAAKVDSHEA